MSLRQQNAGSIVKPGFNPLAAPTPIYSYTYYLMAWGANDYGRLGLGNITNYSSPKQIGALTDWARLSTGSGRAVGAVIKTDSALWSWGANQYGQLGFNNTTNTSSPVQVGALTDWAAVSGNENRLAVKTDGTLWAWGNGQYGAMGQGNTNSYSSPKQVGALTNWATVAAGSQAMLAIKTNGTLWAWGYNSYGQLGVGNVTYYSSPKQVGLLTNWATVTTTNDFTLAIKTDGTLWAWGYNAQGQLGQGNTTSKSSPTQVGALTNWASIGNGNAFALGVTTVGTLLAWGANYQGQLGLGTSGGAAYKSSPTQVGVLTTWSMVAPTSSSSTSAVKTDGTLWTWGSGSNGVLGHGNTTSYSSPKQVGSGTTWFKVSGGPDCVFALKY